MAALTTGISNTELRDIYMSLEKEALVKIIMDLNKDIAKLYNQLNKLP